jgi:hypothetical protein
MKTIEPYETPQEELAMLRRYEVLISTLIESMEETVDWEPELVHPIRHARQLLEECRDCIRRFKTVHRLSRL